MMESRNLVLSRRSYRPVVLALFVTTLGLTGCNNYEPKQAIEGVYRPPPGCARLQGHRDGWFSFTTVYPTVCNPIRVSELGTFTYGAGWESPGKQVEMGRLEFSDGGVYVKTEALRLLGSFEYRTRQATLGDWMRHNPFTTIMLVLVGLVVAVTVVVRVEAMASRRNQERERLEAEATARLERLKAEEVARLEGRLQSITKQIADLSTILKISFPEDYSSSIRAYVESHKADLLINTTGFDRFISSEVAKANDDLSKLKRAAKAFDEVMQLYSRTTSEVNRTGNKAFFHLLHQLLEGLEGLKDFLPKREWNKFHEGVDFIMDELKPLYENATGYQDAYEEECEEEVSSDPYSILGVSEQMDDDQIRKIYLELCNIYHPDKGKVPDDTKFKEINNAYEQIKKMRQKRRK